MPTEFFAEIEERMGQLALAWEPKMQSRLDYGLNPEINAVPGLGSMGFMSNGTGHGIG